jgi:hypothetical protein
MFFIVCCLPFLILILEKKHIFKKLPIFFAFAAILSWGIFGLNKTGKFPILSSSSSFNSLVMAFALNENFHKYYPSKSTDLIPIPHKLPKNIKNEWEFYKFYKEKNEKYLNENFNRYFKDTFIKLKFIFFNINKDGSHPDKNGKFDNKIMISHLISKILFNSSIILSLLHLFNNYKNISKIKKEIYFLFIVILNLLPHITLWATSKHLVGVTNVAMIYLFIYFFSKKK